MNTPAGRRIARPPLRHPSLQPPRLTRGLVVVLAALLVTLAGLAWAGAAKPRTGEAAPASPRAAIGDRVFSCAGQIKGARALHGSAGTGGLESERLTEPARLHVSRHEAPDAFAAQVARGGAALAFAGCPEPASEYWFVGTGGSVGHSTKLVVDNPRPGDAVVNIEVLGPRGPVEAPGLQGVTVAGGASRTFDLSRVAPANGELATHVTTSRGLVSVTAVDRFTLGRIGATTSEWAPDQGPAERRVDLVGLPADPESATLLVANPGQVEAVVELQVVGQKGPFAPKGADSVTVPPGSVGRLDLSKVLDEGASSLRLSSSGPVVATVRSLHGKDQAYASSAAPLDGTSVFAVPEAARRDLLVTALDQDAEPTLVAYDASGARLSSKKLSVAAQTTERVALPAKARFAQLDASGGHAIAGLVVAERGSGLGAVAIPPALEALTLPSVRPGW